MEKKGTTNMEQADILIVNDNLEIQKIIQILLTGEGFRVTEAEDGEQALQNLKKVGFDLIILDIMMPGMDGYHTCSCLLYTSRHS